MRIKVVTHRIMKLDNMIGSYTILEFRFKLNLISKALLPYLYMLSSYYLNGKFEFFFNKLWYMYYTVCKQVSQSEVVDFFL